MYPVACHVPLISITLPRDASFTITGLLSSSSPIISACFDGFWLSIRLLLNKYSAIRPSLREASSGLTGVSPLVHTAYNITVLPALSVRFLTFALLAYAAETALFSVAQPANIYPSHLKEFEYNVYSVPVTQDISLMLPVTSAPSGAFPSNVIV